MPYTLKKFDDNKYKVCKTDDLNKCFSNKTMTKKEATKQMQAIIISENKQRKSVNMNFKERLKNMGFDPEYYLKLARMRAEKKGYDPNLLIFSDRIDKKLKYGPSHFGSSSNNDYIIYNFLEHQGKIKEGSSDKHRNSYLSRAHNIKGDWKNNLNSPNWLAINILW